MTTIEQPIKASLRNLLHHRGWVELDDVHLCYDHEDPLAVYLVFPPIGGNEAVQWCFSIDMLGAGLAGHRLGAGDVVLRPGEDSLQQMIIELRSPTGHVDILVDRFECKRFYEAARGLEQANPNALDSYLDSVISDILKD